MKCSLPLDLYTELKKTLRFRYDKDAAIIHNFVEELPPNLRVKTSIYIHEDIWSQSTLLTRVTTPLSPGSVRSLSRASSRRICRSTARKTLSTSSTFFRRVNAAVCCRPRYTTSSSTLSSKKVTSLASWTYLAQRIVTPTSWKIGTDTRTSLLGSSRSALRRKSSC